MKLTGFTDEAASDLAGQIKATNALGWDYLSADTGNPVFQRDRSKPAPYPWQNAFDFYQKVKHAIAHVHVKDGIMHKEEGEPEYTFAGEGQGYTKEILADLITIGYDGFIAIEPHVGKVFHLKDQTPNPQKEYELYLEYGRRFEKLMDDIKKPSLLFKNEGFK